MADVDPTFDNPYCTLDQVKRALKMALDDTSKDTELREAIWMASRWIDQYQRRTYYMLDYSVTPLRINQYDGGLFDTVLFLKASPIIRIDSVTRGGTALVANGDYYINGESLISAIGPWGLSADNTVEVFGQFGYRQTSVWPVTEAGDTANQLSSWSLKNLGASVVYWSIISIGGGLVRVELFNDSAHSNRIAYGQGSNASTVTLATDNNSGVYGTVAVAYTTDDSDAGNTLTPGTPAIDRTMVPEGIPGHINFACREIAAAFSGHNRKEVAGLDGSKMELLSNSVTKSVYDILGKQNPILV